jgi:hypothetical protein
LNAELNPIWYLLVLLGAHHILRISGLRINITTVKGKAVPLQAWSGPEFSRKLRFPDHMKTQDGNITTVSTYNCHCALKCQYSPVVATHFIPDIISAFVNVLIDGFAYS